MNQEQKPLSTQDIAAVQDARDTSLDTQETARRQDEELGRAGRQDAQTEVYNDVREGHEAGYHESGISDTIAKSALMPDETAQVHREHWTDIQTRFVDDPKDAVEQADELVAEVMQVVATRFADQRKGLESQWQEGGEVSTEDLRQALQQYRSFFERLLAA